MDEVTQEYFRGTNSIIGVVVVKYLNGAFTDENGDYYNLGLHNRFYAIYKIPLSTMATSLDPLKELQIFAKVNNSTPFNPCYFHR